MKFQRIAVVINLYRVRNPFEFISARIPHRNPMPPPKLTADAPVLNVRQPVVIHFRPAFGMKFHPARRHARPGWFHGGIFQKPLFAQARLNRHTRPLAETDIVLVRLFFDEHALLF